MDIWQYNPDGIAFNNSTGAYDIDMPPGKYIIQIWPDDPIYEGFYYNNKSDELDADKVTVVAGQKTDNIDFNFAKIDTGSVSGLYN